MKTFLVVLLCLCFEISHAQTSVIKGIVTDALNNEPVPFATIGIQSLNSGSLTNDSGYFQIDDLESGLYNIEVSCIGYQTLILFEIQTSILTPADVLIQLQPSTLELQNFTVTENSLNKTNEGLTSIRTIGVNEIQRNPGGGRDISKVIQSLPGVNTSVSFRNDIIIRGGAPNENRFYLDEIEVPNINHFATQGSSGGPVGMLNVDLIKEVDFFSSSFPVNKGNALSSVFSFSSKDGRTDHFAVKATVGSSDLALSFEGPTGKNASLIFSARRSYLQLLFKTLGLPFLPTYNDYQFKEKIKFNQKNELSIISIGALDHSPLNLNADTTESQKYILGYLPEYDQWNYAIGTVYKHFMNNHFITVVASRNMLNNQAEKYFNNNSSADSNLVLKYVSQEIENKLRIENSFYSNNTKLLTGVGFEQSKYNNNTFNKISLPNSQTFIVNYNSKIIFYKFNAFVQLSKSFFNDRLSIAAGLRSDFNSYSAQMGNPLKQLSPRFAIGYGVTEKMKLNFSAAKYYQLPAYTVLGFENNDGDLVNKKNGVTYIACYHLVTGFEFFPSTSSKVSVETFYKWYSNYPVQLADSISLANIGSDFGVIGNTAVSSFGSGKSFGIEFLAQQKLQKGFYGICAVTLFRSEFKDKLQNYVPSSWDSRFIVSTTAAKKFGRNWEIGLKWRFTGGVPFTPIDSAYSSLISVWNLNQTGLLDNDQLNAQRLGAFQQLDFRLDKKWFTKKINLNLYLDIQNLYNFKYTGASYLDLIRDANGNAVVNPLNINTYRTHFIKNISGNLLPTIGLVIEI